jgi:hypothetical protein
MEKETIALLTEQLAEILRQNQMLGKKIQNLEEAAAHPATLTKKTIKLALPPPTEDPKTEVFRHLEYPSVGILPRLTNATIPGSPICRFTPGRARPQFLPTTTDADG